MHLTDFSASSIAAASGHGIACRFFYDSRRTALTRKPFLQECELKILEEEIAAKLA